MQRIYRKYIKNIFKSFDLIHKHFSQKVLSIYLTGLSWLEVVLRKGKQEPSPDSNYTTNYPQCAAASHSEIKFLWTAEFAICHFNLQSKLGIVPIIMWNIIRERKNDWFLEYFWRYHQYSSVWSWHTTTVKMLKMKRYPEKANLSPECHPSVFSILVKWDWSVILFSFPRARQVGLDHYLLFSSKEM